MINTSEDEYGNEVREYSKPKEYLMNVQPLSAEANLEEYGSDISQKYKAIIERNKYEGKFKENDLVYLDGANPKGEIKYGENANYKMFPPRIQNKCILIHFKRINTK